MTDAVRKAFIRESNRIEGIHREPWPGEMVAFNVFLALDLVTVDSLEILASVFAPGAELRRRPFMDVGVGKHTPPEGGPGVVERLQVILEHANAGDWSPFKTHCEYENLHPFMDGNGRSGRALWAWQATRNDRFGLSLGFLHTFYYQTLAEGGERHS